MIELDLNSIIFIPTHDPPHRSTPDVSTKNRIEMTRKATAPNDKFEVSELERDLGGPSYTIKTIEHLKDRYPEDELHWVIGADELVDFREWHEWKKLLDACQIIGMNRPGFDLNSIADPVKNAVKFVRIPAIEISSTEIRQRLRRGRPIQYLLPESVRITIRNRGHYTQ